MHLQARGGLLLEGEKQWLGIGIVIGLIGAIPLAFFLAWRAVRELKRKTDGQDNNTSHSDGSGYEMNRPH
jgi:hypothetical protein